MKILILLLVSIAAAVIGASFLPGIGSVLCVAYTFFAGIAFFLTLWAEVNYPSN